jgi:amino acid adenylation domain-containing protein
VTDPDNLDEILRRLSPRQRDLLLRRLRQQAGGAGLASAAPASAAPSTAPSTAPAIAAVPAPAPPRAAAEEAAEEAAELPLSFAQERMWFLDRLDPGRSTYNMAAALRLAGRLDAGALRRALGEVVRRHAVLRATLVAGAAGGRPVQRLAAFAGPPPLPVVDLAGLPAAVRQAAAERLAGSEADRPFDLARGPLLRARLLRLAAGEHVAVFAVHHIVADGASMDVLVRELAALYPACRGGDRPPAGLLPPPRWSFGEFAVWQRAEMSGERLREELAFWRGELAGAPPAAELPADRPRPATQRFHGGALRSPLPAGLEAELRDACRRQGATLFMGLLAAFAACLARHGGVEDLVVGTPAAGRGRIEVEELIGPFLNSLALRADLSGDPAFAELLARTRRRCLAAFAHQDLPFEKLVEELAPERNLAHAPIYQVMLVAQSAAGTALSLPGLTLTPIELAGTTSKMDLTLAYRGSQAGLELRWLYKRDLFERPSVQRLARHFEVLLAAAVADPETRLWQLPLLTAAEAQQLREWNDTVADFPAGQRGGRELCLHELVAARAAGAPGRPAVADGDRILTYAELMAAAGELARRLAACGVGPEVVVGVCAERSLEMVVGLLAVLAAGGAYLPLDPDYPAERLAFMVEDSRVPVVLCQDRLAARLPALPPGTRRLSLDGVLGGLKGPSAGERGGGAIGTVGTAANPDHLAYVIYTSGSTGRPKGTMNSHRGIVNRLLWMQREYGLSAADAVLQKTPFSFDVSVWELFWPLLAGARLVMARPGGHMDSAYLVETIVAEAITTLHFVPSMLQVFLTAPGVERCAALLRVMASGEALPTGLAERFAQRLPAAALHNLYGPTEAAVDVTFWPCARGRGRGGVPIGRPVANTAIVLLDRAGNPVPVGVAGELCIGGVQLARGYLARPDLSAARFVPDAAGGRSGQRLYRTGDLARHLPDGAIEFLGRIDHQVKVRGLRIELGEVEAALAAQPAVREAVVVARTVEGGGGTIGAVNLVAYVTLAAPGSPAPELGELRGALGRTLPEHMLPQALVVLPALPLTASGKVDRRALPAAAAPARRRPFAPLAPLAARPRDAVELRLHQLWSEVLGSGDFGVEDDFFALGGNSITGAVFINRLQEELGEIVHVVALFDSPTVARLAAYLAADYPAAVARLASADGARHGAAATATAGEGAGLTAAGEAGLAEVRSFLRTLPPWPPGTPRPPRNRRALFVLSPPRSGSTLLRVMLAGHPRLFAPPELELLGFNTLRERRAAFPGRDSFRLEGLERAVMEARGCGPDEARALVAELAAGGLTAAGMYGRLQDWIGRRMLVDKTPTYAWDQAVLRRAEESFEAPLYIHLTRHPYGMIRSFEEARIDQIFFPAAHRWTRRQLAELLWLLAHENVLGFLAALPAERWRSLRFEDLVRDPQGELRRLCGFLGLEFLPAMADPYLPGPARMTDGLHAASRMLGDVKFHQHAAVEAAVAERWREWLPGGDFLGGPARAMARRLGYEMAAPGATPAATSSAIPGAAPPAAAAPPAPAAAAGAWAPIPRLDPVPATLPLSFAQERLWFLDQLDPGKATYTIPAALRLRGRLDVAALAASLAEVIRRHAVLRTIYAAEDGRPVQRVLRARRGTRGAPATPGKRGYPDEPGAAAAVPLPLVDLAGGGPHAAEVTRWVLAVVERPFDLARGPVLRALLLRLAPDEHVAVLAMHHIASDGWSMGILVRELAAIYAAARQGRPSPLPEPAIQYADFAVWQRGWLAGERSRTEIAYWRERLAGLPALELPADRPRPPVQTYRGASRRLAVAPRTAAAVASLSRQLGATLFMTTLSAFVALLSRYTGQEDVAVGTPYAGRDRRELEGLIGFFVNTLVMRVDASGGPSFAALTARVRHAAVGAFAHHQVPFEKIVEELQPERDLSRPPLFQLMFVLQNARQEALSLPDLELAPAPFPATTAKFDLTLALAEEDGALAGSVEYNRDLFEAPTIERFARHFTGLLAAVSADPARPLPDVPLLSAAERWQLLGEWNDRWRSWPAAGAAEPAAGVHQLFELQAAARPAAPAVTQGGEGLTYAELEAAANRLARRLRALGVGRETRVGLLVERAPEMVVALLAVLKAGGAYVPLDPAHPAERLAMVAADSGLALLLTQQRVWDGLGAALAAGGAWRVVVLDSPGERRAVAGQAAAPLDLPVEPESLAYVIYTSGSTGRPKGVQLPHRALVNFLHAMAERPGLTPAGVVAAVTTLAFDIAGLEIYLPLAVGARVEVVRREEAADGALLAARLAACGATLLQATPVTWRLLLEAGWEGLPGLTALCGGEALPSELASRLLALGLELWNLYGPTETAVWSAARRVLATGAPGAVPLGGPIASTTFAVADAGLRPVPLGAAGELLIGGAGVARGYLGRPELTAERFLPDPWSTRPGARLYRTGDLVRWRPSADLEFLGRLDHQVKVRGFRIELAEIEAALLRQPAVAEAVVAARGDGGDRRLIAYLVARSAGEDPGLSLPAAGELRAALGAILPDYMVPTVFLVLPRLPRTPTGKVDRQALPAPPASGAGRLAAADHVAPRGPVEESLAAIWSEVLQVERVGAADNFFALGGHSLLATQVASRVRTAFGIELPLARLFAAPTVAALAREVEAARSDPAGQPDGARGASLPPITPAGRGGRPPAPRERVDAAAGLPLSFAQERMWFLGQLEPGSSAYNLASAVRLAGRLETAVLGRAFTEMARRHEALRTTCGQLDGKPVQVIHPPAPVPLPVIDLAALPAPTGHAEARRLVTATGGRPYDLVRGPLLRACLLALSRPAGNGAADDHVLLLGMHHICADGWSINLMVRELAVLYAAFGAGEPSPLPALPIQYADFAIWQRRTLAGEMLERELAYWRRQLAGSPPAVLLPTDRRRPELVRFQAQVRERPLPASLVLAASRLARRRSASLYMTLLAAWKALLLRCTGQRDLLVGAPIANRNRAETEGLIGFFLNTLLLRTEIGTADDFGTLLGRVRDTCLDAFSHQDPPLELVLQAALPERAAERGSPFQIMFLLQNLARQELAVPGLAFSPFQVEERVAHLGTAIFEIGLTLLEAPAEADGLLAAITFNASLFDAATIDRLLGRFATLLAAAADDPGRDLWDYRLTDPAEERQLLAAGGAGPDRAEGGAAAAPAPPPVQLAIARRAALQPDAVAVVAGERRLTYGELDGRAERLAHRLRALGLGPERLAALLLDRSPELLVALLAVLKAGAAYLPLDPDAPAERIAEVLEDAGAALVLTHRRLRSRLPAVAAAGALPVVHVEAVEEVEDGGDGEDRGDAADLAARPRAAAGDPHAAADGEGLAYVIYTSGSTGRPKGVMVRHGSLASYTAAVCADYDLGPRDRVLQFAAISFDTSAEEIYPCLVSGGTLVLRDAAVLASTAELLARCEAWGITVLDLPTAFWHELAAGRERDPRAAPPALPKALRLVIIGGERALPDRLAAWHGWAGGRVRLVNTYGPTETTIVATRAELPPDRPPAGEVPIGVPVAGVRAYVLDPRWELAPGGLPGELFVAGAGVARGYLGRPDLTAERFLPDPWSPRTGERMYRTGDLARWLPEGTLEFLGRADQQVKIRGFRVEPGEIESALAAHPAVGKVAVLAREDGPAGERRLVAYWAPAAGVASPPAGELRAFLARRLPEYMLPAVFVELAELPATPGGKVDRRALPAPDPLRQAAAAGHVAPRTDVERTVAAIYEEVLGLTAVGARDDFFELGGHSMLIPQVLYRVQAAFAVGVPLRHFYDEPTVEGLALAIEETLLDEIERLDLEAQIGGVPARG